MSQTKKSKAAQKAAATRKAKAAARLVVLPVRFYASDLDLLHMAAADAETNACNFVRAAALAATRKKGYGEAGKSAYPRTVPHGGARH